MNSKIIKPEIIAETLKRGLDSLKYLREREDDFTFTSGSFQYYEDEAVNNISFLVKHCPEIDEYVLLLAEALVRSKRFNEIEAHLERLRGISEEYTRYRFEMLYGQERFQEAYEFMSACLKDKRNFQNLFQFGKACTGLKDYEKAIDSYQECIKSFPKNSEKFCLELCEALYESKKKEEGLETCKKFIEQLTCPSKIFKLSIILFHMEYYREAIDGCLKSIKLKPLEEEADEIFDRRQLLLLSYLNAGEENNFLEQLYTLCIQQKPYIYMSEIGEEFVLHEFSRRHTITHLTEIINERDSFNPRIYALLAFLGDGDLIVKGMRPLDLIVKAIEREIGNPVYYQWLYYMHYTFGSESAPEMIFNKAYETHKDIKDIFVYDDYYQNVFELFAETHIRNNNFYEAVENLKKALDYQKEGEKLNYQMLVLCYFELDKIDDAMAIMDKAQDKSQSLVDDLSFLSLNSENRFHDHAEAICDMFGVAYEFGMTYEEIVFKDLIKAKRVEDAFSFTESKLNDLRLILKRANAYYIRGEIEYFKNELEKCKNVEKCKEFLLFIREEPTKDDCRKVFYTEITQAAISFPLDFYLKVLEYLFDLASFRFYLERYEALRHLAEKIMNKEEDIFKLDFKSIGDKPYRYLWMGDEFKDQKYLLSEIVKEYPVKEESLLKCLQRDGEKKFDLLFKNCVTFFLINNCCKDIKEHQHNFRDIKKLSLNNFKKTKKLFEEKLKEETQNIESFKRRLKDKEEERDRVIADISHHIKNIVSSAVIDPLENLKESNEYKAYIVEDALKGASIIREIVNSMNLSFNGSLQDFEYDAVNNSGRNSIDINDIIPETFRYSIANIFEGKFFGNFTHEYFPSIEKYNEAKDAWNDIRNSCSIDEISDFLSKYYFTPDIKITLSESYRIGNARGSAMKLMILFQELVFNAIKYSVFVERDKRFLKFEIRDIDGRINVNIENSFNESAKTKSSGFGHLIIENFAKLLNAELSINKKDGKYTVKLSFKNLWRSK